MGADETEGRRLIGRFTMLAAFGKEPTVDELRDLDSAIEWHIRQGHDPKTLPLRRLLKLQASYKKKRDEARREEKAKAERDRQIDDDLQQTRLSQQRQTPPDNHSGGRGERS